MKRMNCLCCGSKVMIKRYNDEILAYCSQSGSIYHFLKAKMKECPYFKECRKENLQSRYKCRLNTLSAKRDKRDLLQVIINTISFCLSEYGRCLLYTDSLLEKKDLTMIAEKLQISYIVHTKSKKSDEKIPNGLHIFYGVESSIVKGKRIVMVYTQLMLFILITVIIIEIIQSY